MKPVVAPVLAGALLVVLGACAADSPDSDSAATPPATASSPSASPSPEQSPSESPGSQPRKDSEPASPPPGDPAGDIPQPDHHVPVAGASPPERTAPPADPDHACRAAEVRAAEADRVIGKDATKILFVFLTDNDDGCTLSGYPGISLLAPDGRPLDVAISEGGLGLVTEAPETHVLDPGSSVSFFMAVPNGRGALCGTATTVRIGLPKQGGTLDTPTDLAVCGDTVAVTPFQSLIYDTQVGE